MLIILLALSSASFGSASPGWPFETLTFPDGGFYDCLYLYYVCTDKLGTWPQNKQKCFQTFENCQSSIGNGGTGDVQFSSTTERPTNQTTKPITTNRPIVTLRPTQPQTTTTLKPTTPSTQQPLTTTTEKTTTTTLSTTTLQPTTIITTPATTPSTTTDTTTFSTTSTTTTTTSSTTTSTTTTPLSTTTKETTESSTNPSIATTASTSTTEKDAIVVTDPSLPAEVSEPEEPSVIRSCHDILKEGNKRTGVYNTTIGKQEKEVFCDMQSSGGGWTILQRRGDFGNTEDHFFRNWTEYRTGFGEAAKEIWLGLEAIFLLTNKEPVQLRIHLEDWEGNRTVVVVNGFKLSNEEEGYKIFYTNFKPALGKSLPSRGTKFSTIDRDNDSWSKNCAERFSGAWWYTACLNSCLNGLYKKGAHESFGDSIIWYHWKGYRYGLKSTVMKIIPISALPLPLPPLTQSPSPANPEDNSPANPTPNNRLFN